MRKLIILSIAVIAFAACNKKETAFPNFNVSIKIDTVYKAGDEVVFNFSGNPYNITFYSGEPGHMYEFRDRIEDDARTDVGEPLKNMTTRLDSYAYVYETPGTYKAVFVVSNTTVYGSESAVREVEVKINPAD